MNSSEQINELASALAKAQGQIAPAKYDGRNPHLKNRYATLAAIWDAIRNPLSENGLSVVQVVTTEPDGMFLLTRLMHSSGQYIQAVYPITAGDSRGMSSAQAIGSALTYARRYSLTALVGVVSDDDDDGNAAGDTQTQRSQPQEQAKPQSIGNRQQEQDDPPGFTIWADWSRPEHAIKWAMTQDVFVHQKHAQNAYDKVKAERKPETASDMWQFWYNDVQRRIAEKTAGKQEYIIKDAFDDELLFSEEDQNRLYPLRNPTTTQH